MGNPNKYSDGLSFLLFPSNISFGAAGNNFPESTAQDIMGSLSLSFSGSRLPFSTQTAGQPLVGFYRGPSGFAARYTPLAQPTGALYQNFSSQVFRSNTFGAPDLRNIFAVSNIFDADRGAAPMDNGVTSTQRFRDSRSFNTIGQVEVLDLISEGPIEGFVTGIYNYNTSGKVVGDIGYTSATFQPYSTNYSYSQPETRSIFWNDVPITDLEGFYNFQFVDYKYQYGEKTNDHTVFNPYLNLYEYRTDYFGRQVDRNKIPLETSLTKYYGERLYGFYTISGQNQILNPKTYYVYNTNVSSLKISIQINGLFEQIVIGSNAGDIERQVMDIKFSVYRVLDNGSLVILDTSKYSPYIQDYYSRDIIGLQGKVQNSPVIITYTINLRPFAENSPSFDLFQNQIGWAIDITKITLESTTSSLVSNTEVLSITEVYSDRFVYPDSALVFSKFDARYFNEIPTRTYKMRLLKVKIPVNYDPITKTYTGPWNGKFKIAWTDNPAWCFYDIISNNRYGLGKYIDSDLTDKWTLYEIGQYCDQLVSDGFGGLEPRFRCNLYIASKEEAMKVLNDMASIFLGIVYYSAGQIFLSQDSPKDPIYLFNNSNVLNGEFNYSDASKKSRKTVATVRYNDSNDNYKPAIEYIEDRNSILKYGIRETEIVAFGCTNKNQARRVGKWLLLTDNIETETVNFNVGLEGNYLRPGDVISIYDQIRGNKSYAGRTVELTTGYAVLDLPFNFSNTYPITGVNINNSFVFNVLTPTYNFNFGTSLGDSYITGFNPTTSGVSGLNSSFIRRSQVQSILIGNPQRYLTSGSGIYSNNIRINFPYINSIPENITPTNMSKVGNTFTKLAADGWPPTNDAQAYSSVGYSKNMFAEATSNFIDKWVMFGLSTNPAPDASYSNLNYAWYFRADTNLSIFENGSNIGGFGAYTTSTKLRIEYDGEWITYLKDGAVVRSIPATNKNQTLYFDSSFYSNGASINANYGTFALNNYLNTLLQNTVWSIDISTTGYLAAGINTKSNINNPSNLLYPGYYLESYLNKPKKYRVLNINEQVDNAFSITALEYNDQKYTDIDNAGLLINKPIRPASPTQPSLFLSGIFRNSAGSYLLSAAGNHYTTNQGGVNSIMYNIIPSIGASSDSLYYVYVKPTSNFENNFTEENFLYTILNYENLRTGLSPSNWANEYIPSFLTPTGIGNYFFRIFETNSIGERSSATTGVFNLTTQASVQGVITSGRNIY
jgi:hypothetical protein